MVIKYINIFQSKGLKIFANWDFWFENETSDNPEKDMKPQTVGVLTLLTAG
jgi:hypothetical protein